MIKRIIIFPDIHGRTFWRRPYNKYKNDPETLFIFLGDYFDPYPDIDGITPEDAYKNFEDIWEACKDNKNVIFLLGNHDWHYLPMQWNSYGCRRSKFYLKTISDFFIRNLDKFDIGYEFYIKDKCYLFTHAGVLNGWVKDNFDIENSREAYTSQFLNNLKYSDKFQKTLWQISASRFGEDPYGSPLWADIFEHELEGNEFNKEYNIYQIFGHTLGHPSLYEFDINDTYAMLDCEQAFVLDCETEKITTYNKYIEPDRWPV